MLKYILLVLCFHYFGTGRSVSLQRIPSTNLLSQLENNLIRLNSAPKFVTPASSDPSIDSDHPSSVIKARLLELQKLREEYDKPNQQSELDKVIDKIQTRKFTDAEIILRKSKLIDRVPKIVQSAYNSSENNFKMLLDFGSELTEIDLSFGVLFALWDQVKVNENRDIFDVIDLVNAIETRLSVLNATNDWIIKAKTVTNETISEIQSSAVEILKTAMITDNYRNNSVVHKLSNLIFDLASIEGSIWDGVIQRVVNESFRNVSATKITANLNSHKFPSRIIAGLEELFKNLENAKNLNNPAILNIGEYLKQLSEKSNYVNLPAEKKEAVDMMIKKLPLCARNLFFEPFVCIWNKGKSEYLYVAGPEFNRNEDKRSVFTRTTGEAIGPGVWMVEKSGDEFFFRSKAYDNEYLFAASGLHDKDNRFVHTWTEGGKVGNKSSWSIELDDDDCFLRNVNYGEYLFASDRQSGEKSRYAFTWTPKTSTRELDSFRWQLRVCDLSEILRKGV